MLCEYQYEYEYGYSHILIVQYEYNAKTVPFSRLITSIIIADCSVQTARQGAREGSEGRGLFLFSYFLGYLLMAQTEQGVGIRRRRDTVIIY